MAIYAGQIDNSNIQVVLFNEPADTASSSYRQAITDSTGEYRFDGLEPGSYFVVASSEHSAQTIFSPDIDLSLDQAFTVEDLVLTPTGEVSGTVIRPDGGVPLGAEIFLAGTSFSAVADSFGNYLMDGVITGSYDLFAFLAGYEITGPFPVTVSLGTTTAVEPITLGLAPGAGNLLIGTALLSDQTNHSGITISLTGNGVNLTTQTDVVGYYAFSGMPAGSEFQIVASKNADYDDATLGGITVVENQLNRADTVVLQAKPGTIEGVVTLEGETDHVGFTVDVLDTGPSLTQTDALLGGAFSLANVPAGFRVVEIGRPGFETVQKSITVTPNSVVSIVPLELTFRVGTLDATFTLEGATNHEDIVVTLENSAMGLLYSGRTDETGRVRLEGVRAETYLLTARKIGSNYRELNLNDVPVLEGELTTIPNETFPDTLLELVEGSIAGTVQLNKISDFNGGSLLYDTFPCEGCQVVAAGQATLTDGEGGFLLIGIPEGDHTVTVSFDTSITEQYDPFTSQPISISASVPAYAFPSPLTLYESTGTIIGVALLEGAADHSNIQVTVEGLTGYTVATDSLGNFVIPQVPVGNYSVTATLGPDYVSASHTDVTVRVDQTTFLSTLQVTALPGAFTGTFVKEGLTDHSGIVVTIGGQSATTDATGLVSIPAVPAGIQNLSATADGFAPYNTVVTIPPNNVLLHPETTLSAVTGEIAGKVELAGLTDFTGVSITVLNTSISTTSAFDGTYSIQAAIGNYDGLLFRKPLFADLNYNETITVTDVGTANIPIQIMTQSANGLTGVATLAGQTDHSAVRVLIEGVVDTPTFGYTQVASADAASGNWGMTDVPLGEYVLTAIHAADATWETVTQGLSVVSGDVQSVPPIELRQIFIKINDDAAVTTDPSVSLSLGALGASTMHISDDGGGDSGMIAFQSTLPWTLPNQGDNTVSVTYFDSGGVTISTVSATIFLDSIAAIATVTEDSGGVTLVRGDTIHFTLDAGETDGVATVDIVGYRTGIVLQDFGLQGDTTADNGVYEADFVIVTAEDISAATVTGYFTDQYGNVAASANAIGTITIGTAPQVSAVQVQPSTDALSAIVTWLTDEPADSYLEYGTTTAYLALPVSLAEFVTSHQVTLSGLTRGEVYHFRITSADPQGNQTVTGDRTFRVAPAITVGVNAFAGDSEAYLVWSPNTEENLVGYNIYRSTTSGSGFIKQNATLLTGTLYTDTTVINNTTYYYKVSAVDSFSIEGALSNEASATPITITPSQTFSGIIGSNTVWFAAGNPWQITGDVLVANGAALYILPGTFLEFQDNYKIRVEGELQIIGAPSNKVTLTAAATKVWKGIEWIAGASGAVFNNNDIYQSGSALRHVDISGAGANGFTWLRLEQGIGLYLEGVTIGNCTTPCLVAEDLGTSQRVVIDGGAWNNGTVSLTGGGLDLKNATFDGITLTQTGGEKPGVMTGNTFTNSDLSLTRGFAMDNNIWTGGSLTMSRNYRLYDNTSDLDMFTDTTVNVDEVNLTNGDFAGGSLTIGWFSTLDNFSLTSTPLTATGNVTLSYGTIDNSSVSIQHGVVENSVFTGTSPVTLSGNGQVKANTMNANPITISGYGAVEENTLSGVSITLGNGLVRANTVTNGSIQVTGTEGTEILDNVVTGAIAEGLRVNPKRIVMAHNTVTGSDVGLLVTNGDILFFLAYDNTFTGNRVGIQWNGGCSADCDLVGTRFDLSGNVELAFSGDYNSGGLVDLTLRDSWWGTTDPAAIKAHVFDRFDPASAGTNTVGLLFSPWISGPTAIADFDGDTILDWLDGDDDNDGICDLQEARESRLDLNPPVFFNPVDETDTPVVTADCDGDTVADADDTDDDNDGLLDTFEIGTLGTNPFVEDTDGDSIIDLTEYDQLYDALNDDNYPITSNRGYWVATNTSSSGGIPDFADSWIVHGFVSVPAGLTLKFQIGTRLEVNGLLLALGTVVAPIVFTSAQIVPTAGDWEGIDIIQGGATRIYHVSISYSGSTGIIFDGTFGDIGYTLISNSDFFNNKTDLAQSGGAVSYYQNCENNQLLDSSFDSNSTYAYGSGAAVSFYNSYGNVILGSNFSNNSAFSYASGGAVSYRNASDNLLCNSTFSSNSVSSGEASGALNFRFSSNNTVCSSTFSGNSASGGSAGGAVNFEYSTDNVISGSIFFSNSTNGNGSSGAVSFIHSSNNNVVRGSTFSSNSAASSSSGAALNFKQGSSSNAIVESILVSHSTTSIYNNDISAAIDNTVDDSYIAGNNGAAAGVADLSEGTVSTTTPPQWQGVTVTNPRSTPHPDAPPIP